MICVFLLILLCLNVKGQATKGFELKELIRQFELIDLDGDGFITPHELRLSNSNITEDQVSIFFDIYDEDDDATVTFEEYLVLLDLNQKATQS